jgi:DNA-binding NtrC family response regulator
MHDATLPRARPELVLGGTLTDAAGRRLVVGLDPCTVGRDASADLCVPDPEVSALHCELRATAEGVVLRDLGSRNGTFVGDLRIRECLLTGPRTLRVGGTELGFAPGERPQLVVADGTETSFGALLGASTSMRRVFDLLKKIAPTELSVLLTGETGTGKELAARAIHDHSPRAKGPFAVIDCSALPASLAESILFGHEKGAFTGAAGRKDGAFHAAHGGTVFLDELGELPDELQPKLLRVIAERSVKRVGSNRYEPVDVRVIAATRRDLRREINTAKFREDLFFRVAQTRVELPPLRTRPEDVSVIAKEACRRMDRHDAAERVAAYLMGRLGRYDWPGNAREVVNVASVLAALGDGVEHDLLPLEAEASVEPEPDHGDGSQTAESFARAKRVFEERYFAGLLETSGGNISEVARRCGLARHQVRAHLRKLGLMR